MFYIQSIIAHPKIDLVEFDIPFEHLFSKLLLVIRNTLQKGYILVKVIVGNAVKVNLIAPRKTIPHLFLKTNQGIYFSKNVIDFIVVR